MIGIVCGLQSEAQAARSALGADAACVAVSGASSLRARELAGELAAAGARALVSVGIAGGLSEALHAGDLILAERVIAPDGASFDAHPETLARAGGLLTGTAQACVLAGSDTLVTTPADKRALAARTQAAAVDMESHAVASVAAETGRPFWALRAIADPVDRATPRAASVAIDAHGRTRLAAVAFALLARPQDLPDLMRLGRESAAAHASLRRGLRLLHAGGFFAGPVGVL